ncbi:CesD/SycD/LcrH family type III secretion system chaperone [Escherichia albertii]|uniref:tetratricopeptide repeat protein n=1 Tax=Escherichia albertii TaxID=208962 RepID=UPI000F66B442|nr:tetratricopeptide repeat protein [Escherichia albertii]EFO1267099.1 CesD/SycD/LcrH family type III secretion system chaperone [Escherichia albertii]MCZ8803869.1 tetratricopeptide repeat protein [Escherichia albertii]MCZ9060331.1 tetratricopeptide repeat protein [Escherichia albertii]
MNLNLPVTFKSNDEWAEQLKEALSQGKDLAPLHGLTPELLDRIYAYAYDFYEKGRMSDAENFYRLLCIYDFKNYEYLKGYAAVCQSKKKYQQAYELFQLSYNLSPFNDFFIIYRMGQCQIGAKNIENAINCFNFIINNCDDERVKNKAQAYIELLVDDGEDINN